MDESGEQLWNLTRSRWDLFLTRYVWVVLLVAAGPTSFLVESFGHTRVGAGPALTAWLPILLVVEVALLHRVATCGLEAGGTEVVVRNVLRTHHVARSDIVSIGARRSPLSRWMRCGVLVLWIRDDGRGTHPVAVEASRCPTLMYDEVPERARRLAEALGTFVDATGAEGLGRGLADRRLDVPARQLGPARLGRPPSLGRPRRRPG